MKGRPNPDETAPYYLTYINKIASDDIVSVLESQVEETTKLLRGISEEKSLHRYAPDKWSIRQVVNHISDTERAFQFRTLWFARGFREPLPSFDQNISVDGAMADSFPLSAHVEEFRHVRAATLDLFRHLPEDAWMRTGIASGNKFTVRALAYVIGGHAAHHVGIIKERYL